MSGSTNETRTYTVKRTDISFGRTSVVFDCPFCGLETRAYIWSLAGSGKRCPCGAKHSWLGQTSALDTEAAAKVA